MSKTVKYEIMYLFYNHDGVVMTSCNRYFFHMDKTGIFFPRGVNIRGVDATENDRLKIVGVDEL